LPQELGQESIDLRDLIDLIIDLIAPIFARYQDINAREMDIFEFSLEIY